MVNVAQLIVRTYLDKTKMTLREFGEQLGVSHVTVSYWRNGKFAPDTDLMMSFRNSDDWRGEFARAILAAKHGNGGK